MPDAPAIDTGAALLKRIRAGVSRLRQNLELALELGRRDSDTARRILEERGLIAGPHWRVPAHARTAVRLLDRLMRILGLDPEHVAATEPEVMRTMQRACIACSARPRCEQAFERCASRAIYEDFCPNAELLDVMRQKQLAA